jgi:hypothetical protein
MVPYAEPRHVPAHLRDPRRHRTPVRGLAESSSKFFKSARAVGCETHLNIEIMYVEGAGNSKAADMRIRSSATHN